MAALVLMTLVALSARGNASVAPRLLVVEMRASGGTYSQLFWSDDLGFVEERSARVPLRTADGFQRLTFALPSRAYRWLRFDPTQAAGTVSILTMQLLDANGTVLAVLKPERLHPYQQIASMTRDGDVTHLVTTPGAVDPYLLVPLPAPDGGSIIDRLSLVTPASLALVSIALLALLVATIVAVSRSRFERPAGDAVVMPPRWQPALWIGVLFLVVFSARLLLVRENPVTVPHWDQWDIEASWLFVPYQEDGLSWRMMFSLANEHRVFFTRLLALDLLVVNGQWDPRLQQVVDAALHALNAVLLVAIFWLANQRRRLDLLVFIGALCFAPPFAWENILLPIQSAAYLLVLFTILSLALTTTYPVGTRSWLLGWICAGCALFTFASGIFVPVAIMAIALLKIIADRQGWRDFAANAVLAAGLAVSGLAMMSSPIAHHAPLKARTIAEFAGSLGHNLSWPWIHYRWLSVAMWLPVTALLVAAIWRRGKTTTLERLVVGLACWVVLSAAAIAYGRGAGAAIPATRYMDYLSLGLLANTMALVAAVERAGAGQAIRRVALAGLAGWLIWVSVGVDQLSRRSLDELMVWRGFFANHVVNLRRATASGDFAPLMLQAPLSGLPYPDPARLTTLLQDAYIRQILPAVVRAPARVEPQVATNGAFVLQGPGLSVPHDPVARAWWSLSGEGRKTVGRLESEPMACGSGPRLRFQVAGYLGWPGQYLAVRELSTGRELPVQPDQLARDRWQDVVVSCPAGPFAVIAVDDSPDSWFGFREPVEIGRASVAIESMIANSREMLLVALALAVLAVRWTGATSNS
jgi:hypothetical protein